MPPVARHGHTDLRLCEADVKYSPGSKIPKHIGGAFAISEVDCPQLVLNRVLREWCEVDMRCRLYWLLMFRLEYAPISSISNDIDPFPHNQRFAVGWGWARLAKVYCGDIL